MDAAPDTEVMRETSDNEENDVDPELAAAMGFSSFGNSSKKRKYKHEDAVVDGQSTKEGILTHQGGGANAMPLGSKTPSADAGLKSPKPTMTLPHAAQSPHGSAQETAGHKSPANSRCSQEAPCHEQADLRSYRKGVRQPNGDMAYFQPSFIEDPWKR